MSAKEKKKQILKTSIDPSNNHYYHILFKEDSIAICGSGFFGWGLEDTGADTDETTSDRHRHSPSFALFSNARLLYTYITGYVIKLPPEQGATFGPGATLPLYT